MLCQDESSTDGTCGWHLHAKRNRQGGFCPFGGLTVPMQHQDMSRQDLLSKNGNKCWPNGSLRTDSSQNLQICCNFRNLPSAFIVGSMTAPSAEVTYLWDGTKVKTSSALGHGRLYKGSFVYSVSPTSTQLESISHDEGRILAAAGASGTEFIDTWHVRDYLGSVRAVYDISTPADEVADASEHVLEQSDYYAFGGRIDTSGQAFDQTNRYRYNGKEQLRFESLNLDPGLTDYGARYYAPTFGRWASPDPLADKYYSVSPYAFCNNNPVNFVDPDGRDILDKFVGYSLGLLTNVVPGTGRVRDLYTPTDSRDYNSALRDVDNAAAVVGTGMTKVGGAGMIAGGAAAAAGVGMTVASGGTAAVVGAPVVALGAEVAVAGAKTTAAGIMLMANSAQNKSGGYERGNTSSGNKNSKHANQDAKNSAKAKYEEAKNNYSKYNSIPNKTSEDTRRVDNYKKQMNHWKKKMDYQGENHSRNAKGNR